MNRGKQATLAFRAWLYASVLALVGCGGAAENSVARYEVAFDEAVRAEFFAGKLSFRLANTFSTKAGHDLPVAFYLGFDPLTQTRLGVKAFADLRGVQDALPDIINGTVDPNCGLSLDIALNNAKAEGTAVRGAGTVRATVFNCSGKGTENERRGLRMLTQTIDVEAVASVDLEGGCFTFSLTELDLAPRGAIGGMANLLGITERARKSIFEEATAKFIENPVCPELPDALAILEPRFSEVSLQEIGNGGMGATLVGSFDVSADHIVQLLAIAQAQNILPQSRAPATGAGVRFWLEDAVTVPRTDVPVGIDLGLAAVGPTRLSAETVLDLREFQAQLSSLVSGAVLLDICSTYIELGGLEAEAQGRNVKAAGPLDVERFDCKRIDDVTWKRGASESVETVYLQAEMTAELQEGCIRFHLLEFNRDPGVVLAEQGPEGLKHPIRALIAEAITLLLEDRPICPELPSEFDILDPRFELAEPLEIEDGGLGVAVNGSVDLNTTTLIEVLKLLQDRRVLPARP